MPENKHHIGCDQYNIVTDEIDDEKFDNFSKVVIDLIEMNHKVNKTDHKANTSFHYGLI